MCWLSAAWPFLFVPRPIKRENRYPGGLTAISIWAQPLTTKAIGKYDRASAGCLERPMFIPSLGPGAKSSTAFSQRSLSTSGELQASCGPVVLQCAGIRDRRCAGPQEHFHSQYGGTAFMASDLMDGRPHPTGDDLAAEFSWSFGRSLGRRHTGRRFRWFQRKAMDAGSYPTTRQLHMIERISRPNLKTLSYEFTIDDPGAYTTRWSGKWTITEKTASAWVADGEMFEYICQDSRS